MNCIPFTDATDFYPIDIETVKFNEGELTKTHNIIIKDDYICEMDGEEFFSNIEVGSDNLYINVTVPEATVVIDDLNEGECGMCNIIIYTELEKR